MRGQKSDEKLVKKEYLWLDSWFCSLLSVLMEQTQYANIVKINLIVIIVLWRVFTTSQMLKTT